MASKPKDDYTNTYHLIRNFWPDFDFKKEDLMGGNGDFVVRFYRNFVYEVNDKIGMLMNEDPAEDEFEGIQLFDPMVELYCKVAKFLTKMKYAYLTLSDFLNQNSKRIHTHVKFCIHFVIYVNNFLEALSAIANESSKRLAEVQDLRILKEELLQEIGETSRVLGDKLAFTDQLDCQLKEVNHQYEQMLKDKEVDDKEVAEKLRELELLQNECANLDYEVQFLEEQESNLKKCIITDEEFAKLKNTRKNLQEELERLSKADCTSEQNVDKEFENVQQLRNYGIMLQDLTFEHLYVATASDLKEENQLNVKLGEELKIEQDQYNKAKTKAAAEVKLLEIQLRKIENFCDVFQKSISADEEKQKLQFENKLKEFTAHFEEAQLIRAEISAVKAEIEKVEKDKKELGSVVAQEYKEIVETNRKCTNTFSSWLSDWRPDSP